MFFHGMMMTVLLTAHVLEPPSTTIQAPSGWINVWAVGYLDQYDMLYIGGPPGGHVAYGTLTGSGQVSWTEFDTVPTICGFGCYQDDALYAITQNDPFNPGPFYLYSWNLDASGIPQLPAEVYQLGDPFTGMFGGCEWDGDYLWILDQNFEAADEQDFASLYKYDVDTHTVQDVWDYGELGGVGVACVWDFDELSIWVSDWYGGFKIVEHTETGSPTGQVMSIATNSTDMAFKYESDYLGSGFFVGRHDTNAVDFYPFTLSALTRVTWGAVKTAFD